MLEPYFDYADFFSKQHAHYLPTGPMIVQLTCFLVLLPYVAGVIFQGSISFWERRLLGYMDSGPSKRVTLMQQVQFRTDLSQLYFSFTNK